jgi:hypothetical protein
LESIVEHQDCIGVDGKYQSMWDVLACSDCMGTTSENIFWRSNIPTAPCVQSPFVHTPTAHIKTEVVVQGDESVWMEMLIHGHSPSKSKNHALRIPLHTYIGPAILLRDCHTQAPFVDGWFLGMLRLGLSLPLPWNAVSHLPSWMP